MRAFVALLAVSGGLLAFGVDTIPSTFADPSLRSAIVGQWKISDPNDSSFITFVSASSWEMGDSGKVRTGGDYEWTATDTVRLNFAHDGRPKMLVLRVQVVQDTLRMEGFIAGKIVNWSRVRMPSGRTAENAGFATVRFEGVVIGLAKVPNSAWDLDLKISKEDLARFKSAALKAAAKGVAAMDPWVAMAGVTAAIAAASVDHLAAPDAMGSVWLEVDGRVVGGQQGIEDLETSYNKYTPAWSADWVHVPLDCKHDVRLSLRVEDYDPVGQNDQIGTVQLNRDALLRAAKLQKVVPVYVGDQGNQDQLVFVNVSVTMENGATATQCGAP